MNIENKLHHDHMSLWCWLVQFATVHKSGKSWSLNNKYRHIILANLLVKRCLIESTKMSYHIIIVNAFISLTYWNGNDKFKTRFKDNSFTTQITYKQSTKIASLKNRIIFNASVDMPYQNMNLKKVLNRISYAKKIQHHFNIQIILKCLQILYYS